MQQPRRSSVQSDLHRARHFRRGHALQRRFVEIDFQIVLRLRIFHVPVDVHHARRLLKNLFYFCRQFHLALVVGAVDLRDERLEDRRAGRNFRHLDSRSEGSGDLVQFRPQPSRDVVALRVAIVEGEQVDLDVGLIGSAPQEIVPHEAIEIVRAGRAGINLIVDDLRLPAQITSQRLRHARRLLERRAVGHVDDHLELALIVEGQHLDLHPFQRDERDRRKQQHNHAAKKRPPPP